MIMRVRLRVITEFEIEDGGSGRDARIVYASECIRDTFAIVIER